MTLDQLIIQSEVLENIPSTRRKTHFLQFAQKKYQKIVIIGNKDSDFIQDYFINHQNPNFQIEPNCELIDILELNEIEPEQAYVLTHSTEYQTQAQDLEINYSHKPTNLDNVIKQLK